MVQCTVSYCVCACNGDCVVVYTYPQNNSPSKTISFGKSWVNSLGAKNALPFRDRKVVPSPTHTRTHAQITEEINKKQ